MYITLNRIQEVSGYPKNDNLLIIMKLEFLMQNGNKHFFIGSSQKYERKLLPSDVYFSIMNTKESSL